MHATINHELDELEKAKGGTRALYLRVGQPDLRLCVAG